jgi:hypothetical protein
MKNKIGKNYYLSFIAGGIVVACYYANSLLCIPELKEKHKADEVEVFDVSKYGFSFGDAPVIKVEGGPMAHGVRCRETGKTWRSVKECCNEVGLPMKTLYTSLRRGSRVYGYHYDYFD